MSVLPKTNPPPTLAWQTILAALGGPLFILPFLCACGHLGRQALLATVPTLLLAWWGFTRRLSPPGRLLAAAIAILGSIAFAKNLLDVGWFGHGPLFR